MASYADTTIQELVICDQKLKEIRNVIDTIIVDYNEVPMLKKLFTKQEMYSINEGVVKAQTGINLILKGVERREQLNG